MADTSQTTSLPEWLKTAVQRTASDNPPTVAELLAELGDLKDIPIEDLTETAEDENEDEMEEGYTAADLFQPDSDTDYPSLMVAIPVPESVAAQLELPGGVPASQMHVTLAYCGDTNLLTDEAIAHAIICVHKVARWQRPLTGKINGVGRFYASPNSGGYDVLHAIVDVPGLGEFRTRLHQLMRDYGCPPLTQHDYNPHITLAYLEPDSELTAEIPTVPFLVDKIAIYINGEMKVVPLTGEDEREHMMYAEPLGEAELAHVASEDGTYRLFNSFEFAEPPNQIPYLPKPGTYTHQVYGKIVITRESNERFATNFNNGIYQSQIPIDAEHQTKLSGAVGWITALLVNEDGSVDAAVSWTDRGNALIESDRFKYFSPEWFEKWCDPATEVCYEDVAIGGAITTRPFFKEKSLRPLIASESEASISATADDETPIVFAAQPTTAAQRNLQRKESAMSNEHDTPTAESFAELTTRYEETAAQVTSLTERLDEEKQARLAAEAQATAMAEQNQALADRVARMENEATEKRFNEMVNGPTPWYGDADKHVGILKTLASTFGEDSDEFKTYVDNQKAMAEQLAESVLFKEIGSSNSGNGPDAGAKLDAAARKLMSEDATLTYAQAYTLATEQNAQLYNEYLAEVS